MRLEAAIASDQAIRAELGQHLARLWRYGLVSSRQRHVAEDLVQATCVRALERAGQFVPGTRMDRWLLSILHSIWLNEVRAQRVRQGQGFVDADSALSFDGEYAAQTALCITRSKTGTRHPAQEQRRGMNIVYWSGMEHAFMVIGHNPTSELVAMAQLFRSRFSV